MLKSTLTAADTRPQAASWHPSVRRHPWRSSWRRCRRKLGSGGSESCCRRIQRLIDNANCNLLRSAACCRSRLQRTSKT